MSLLSLNFCIGEGVDHPASAWHWKDIANERVNITNIIITVIIICMIPVLVVHMSIFIITIMIRGEAMIQKWRVTFQRPPTYGKRNCSWDKYILHFRQTHFVIWTNLFLKVEGHISPPANIWWAQYKGIPFHDEFNLQYVKSNTKQSAHSSFDRSRGAWIGSTRRALRWRHPSWWSNLPRFFSFFARYSSKLTSIPNFWLRLSH